MALIDKTRNTLNSLFQKGNRGLPTVDEFNDGFKYVQNKIIREAFDFINNIKNNAKIGRVVKVDYDKERFYRDVVRKIQAKEVLTYNATTETFDLPSDYSLMDYLTYTGGDRPTEIDEVSYMESFVLSDPDVASDEYYPVCFLGATDVEVIPTSITDNVKMYYYRQAKYPKWTYQVVDGKPLFDPDKDDFQDFELPDSIFDEIIRECALYFGIQMQIPNVAQAMENEENKSEQMKRTN